MKNLALSFRYSDSTQGGARSVASSCYGFSGDETVTAGTITPSQMTLQAMTDDEEDFDEMVRELSLLPVVETKTIERAVLSTRMNIRRT